MGPPLSLRQSGADAANVPSEELVTTLLRQARDLLAADTIALLTLDGSGTQLVAERAIGLEEEVQQGLRIPVGAGMSGTVAATGEPMVLNEVSPATVVNPLLIDKGLRALAAVPIHAADRLIGVVHVGSLEPRGFDADDIATLQTIGDQIAATIVAEHERADNVAAAVLQRGLLPTRLPHVEGLEFAARFVPATPAGVGGDWYDAAVFPDGRILVVVGDVAGHGLVAATVMGRLRSVVRAYAFESDDPGDVIARTSRKFQHFEPREMATLLVAQIAPDLDEIRVATAAHPPPIVVTPGAAPRFVDVPPAPPIGHVAGTPRTVTVPFDDDTTFVTYTDGLFERRAIPFDQALERLREAVQPGPIEAAVSALMRTMIRDGGVDDDTALLAVRRVVS